MICCVPVGGTCRGTPTRSWLEWSGVSLLGVVDPASPRLRQCAYGIACNYLSPSDVISNTDTPYGAITTDSRSRLLSRN